MMILDDFNIIDIVVKNWMILRFKIDWIIIVEIKFDSCYYK